jgi:hypothetical protein
MAGYIGTQPVPQATQTRDSFTCTAGQTSFATSGYTPGFLDVYLNGIKLAAADYTASNGSDVVLASGAALDDILEVVAYTSFEVVTDTVTNAGTVLNLDRTGSDGTILDLKKDGTTVGSIGTSSNTEITLAGLDAGIGIIDHAVVPTQGDGLLYRNDNEVDLGRSDTRFKDLYLSGGVYLGGTGSANKLDDYEEGTFTPVLYGGSVDPSVAYTVQAGSYTKVGNIVTVLVDVRWSSQSGGSGVAIIGGLPFSSVPNYSYCAIGEKSASWSYSTYTQYTASIINNDQARVLVSANGLGSAEFPITSLGTGSGYIIFSLTYKTNA